MFTRDDLQEVLSGCDPDEPFSEIAHDVYFHLFFDRGTDRHCNTDPVWFPHVSSRDAYALCWRFYCVAFQLVGQVACEPMRVGGYPVGRVDLPSRGYLSDDATTYLSDWVAVLVDEKALEWGLTDEANKTTVSSDLAARCTQTLIAGFGEAVRRATRTLTFGLPDAISIASSPGSDCRQTEDSEVFVDARRGGLCKGETDTARAAAREAVHERFLARFEVDLVPMEMIDEPVT